jgi:menaquinone-specific isochorismate synthase
VKATSTASLTAVRAVTREVDAPDDVLDALGHDGIAWLHDGAAFATAGVAARVPDDEAVALLAAIDHDADPQLPGTGPLAFGALPFDPAAPAEMIVPARVVGCTADGRGWVTELAPELRAPGAPDAEPTQFAVSAGSTRDAWHDAVRAIVAAIGRGELEKVVLARSVTVDADRPFDRRAVLRRLRSQQPGCFVYAADGMVGASPELLVARFGRTVVSRPMAGTAVPGDDALEELRRSAKDGWEHRLVVDAMLAALAPVCDQIAAASEPEIDTFADVSHLATPVHGTLRDPAPDVLSLVRRLHPTPAVAGIPVAAALEVINRLEAQPRGRYAGPVGWVNARGDGEWAVALRGAAIDGPRAVLHAGAGIVAGSDPDAEWIETQAKLQPMLTALVRP